MLRCGWCGCGGLGLRRRGCVGCGVGAGRFRGGLGVGEQPVDLACDVAFEAADGLAAGAALGAAARGVVDALLMDAQPHHGDAPQGLVGLAVAAAVEPVAGSGA